MIRSTAAVIWLAFLGTALAFWAFVVLFGEFVDVLFQP